MNRKNYKLKLSLRLFGADSIEIKLRIQYLFFFFMETVPVKFWQTDY